MKFICATVKSDCYLNELLFNFDKSKFEDQEGTLNENAICEFSNDLGKLMSIVVGSACDVDSSVIELASLEEALDTYESVFTA